MSPVLESIQAEQETPAAAIEAPLNLLVSAYLSVLANERGSSAHTLRAYERELRGFVAYILETQGDATQPSAIEHTRIRAWMGSLYDRGLAKPSIARALAAV